ncbi:capsid associated protein [Choristoneura fumiferana multiple nucleopolyhedrovirus]|uniref:Capsid associated protein n=1 Tax=Choristoneura fumiferana nuclear polyhedrosis virus TaxID=208973 RepID=O41446_NPVCF|nr:capsid associated protein [Choristoneura fumiferana multiple nucleopolyhedrovirus]AAD45969.1 capsid-associated protein p87 [Choristoneura fumiferana multiple nucleopolyhedrovirus]AAP29879.1 capsid associated protein [Choristoneura fumiferana multiple nucleopolyhedrovirus]
MDEQNSLRIAKLAGDIMTRGHADIKTIIHSPERALGQKLDAITALVDSMQPGEPPETDVEFQSREADVDLRSILTRQDRVLRHRVLQIAVTFLLNSPQVKLSKKVLQSMQIALDEYTAFVTEGGSDNVKADDFLNRAETLYKEIRPKIFKFIKRAENFSIENVVSLPPTTGGSNAAQQINAPQELPVITNEQDFDRLNIEQLTDYIKNNFVGQFDFDKHGSVEDVRDFAKTVWWQTTTYTAPASMPSPPQTPASMPSPPQTPASMTSPPQTPASMTSPPQTPAWATPYTSPTRMTSPTQQGRQSPPDYTWEERLRQKFPEIESSLPENVSLPDSSDEEPFIGQRKRRRHVRPLTPYSPRTTLGNESSQDNEPRRRDSYSTEKESKTPNNELLAPSSDEDEPDHERERKRRREEDKNFLRLQALKLIEYANVNERMEKIVQVTRAMQKTYDYCNCKNTISGTPDAANFVNLLRRLNTYNLSHVEMTVNFYELLYSLTLYNDESNSIINYIFAAAKYFQNCAKNFVRMRAEFNAHGPFAQIESMVMFVIKFNFLCDLQAFFGKIDSLPTLGQPNMNIHTVLVMRDKIVKQAFNALQYDTTPKIDNRRDPKHLQRLIQLMNADFNII